MTGGAGDGSGSLGGLVKGCGIALVLGGLLLALVNVVLTPLMAAEPDEAIMRTSTVYLVRLSLAGFSALFLVFGSLGVHLARRGAAGALGAIAFVTAFIGSCLVVALEWSNVFVLRPVAQVGAEILPALGDSVLMGIGFASAASLFALGWLLLAISALRSGGIARRIPATVIVGLVAIPLLGASPLGMNGAILGNLVFGGGLAAWGLAITKAA